MPSPVIAVRNRAILSADPMRMHISSHIHIVFRAAVLMLLLPAASVQAAEVPAFNPPGEPETVYSMQYRVRKEGRENFTARTRVWRARSGGQTVLAYRHTWPEKSWAVAADARGYPHRMVHTDGNNGVRLLVSENGTVRMTGIWNGRKIEKCGNFTPPVSIESCLVAQNLSGNPGEAFEFQLIRSEKMPRLESRRMRFEVLDRRRVKVPAGRFDCLVLRLTTANPILRAFYSGTLFLTDDERRILIKSENVPKDANLELVRISRETQGN
jgi:hypothetical protein